MSWRPLRRICGLIGDERRREALLATFAPVSVLLLLMAWVFVGINIRGVRESGFVALATTVLKLLPLIGIGLIGLQLLYRKLVR